MVMSDVWGSNPAQLRELARLCAQGSATITAASAAITSSINNPFLWKGGDADRVRGQWNGSMRLQISAATDVLEKVSAELLGHADEQDTASGEGGGALPIQPLGGPGVGSGGSGPDDRQNAFAAGWEGFTEGWNVYNTVKAIPNMRAGLYDIARIQALGGPWTEAAFASLRSSDVFSGMFNASSDLFDGNFHVAAGLAEGTAAFRNFQILGNTLGGIGIAVDVVDMGMDLADGDYGGAVYSGAKAVLGGLSFAPPPVGTAAMVASGALALYDNVPIVHDTVNAVGGAIADGATAAAGAAADAADAVGDTLADGAEAVGDFFGF
jgi:hypothetical protein